MFNSNGIILYTGPSLLDHSAPIVCIATGLKKASANAKAGGLIQTYIFRADMSPLAALETGHDSAICGTCIHRPRLVWNPERRAWTKPRSCYVNIGQAPLAVYRAFKRGAYARPDDAAIGELLAGRKVRLGAYGDPAAVPLHRWNLYTSTAKAWTGYTHAWRTASPLYSLYCMASVESESEAQAARALGYRTFRVRPAGAAVAHGEAQCPASKESGRKLQCADCMACNGIGTARKSGITIQAHGTAAAVNAFEARAAC